MAKATTDDMVWLTSADMAIWEEVLGEVLGAVNILMELDLIPILSKESNTELDVILYTTESYKSMTGKLGRGLVKRLCIHEKA